MENYSIEKKAIDEEEQETNYHLRNTEKCRTMEIDRNRLIIMDRIILNVSFKYY